VNVQVFIDTNILLNFFHYTKEELDSLNNVFASHEHGSAKVYLTQQVCDEFMRNRETKIKDALKRFNQTSFAPVFPSFMKGYEEYESIRGLNAQIQKKQKAILKKVNVDIAKKNLVADRLIGDIFKSSKIAEVTEEIFAGASKRMALGNPPGKKNSLGDAINWIILLNSVPDGENIHVISEDGDFYSTLDEESAHPFLQEEWGRTKKASLKVYRTLSSFMKEHFDGVAFSFDKEKDSLIDELSDAGNFAWTHGLVEKLEKYSYFSAKEVHRILNAVTGNKQVRLILTDWDVSDFLNRIAVPHLASITSDEHKAIMDEVIKEKRERKAA